MSWAEAIKEREESIAHIRKANALMESQIALRQFPSKDEYAELRGQEREFAAEEVFVENKFKTLNAVLKNLPQEQATPV